MSDNEGNTAGDASNGGMPAADIKFLISCLQNTTQGSISVDTNAVAAELGYKNNRSVGNKIAVLKKKYNLPFGASGKSASDAATPKKASDAAGSTEPAVPKTPSKNKVTKQRATPSSKKTPKGKKAVKKEIDEDMADVGAEDDEDELSVKVSLEEAEAEVSGDSASGIEGEH